MHLTQSWSLWLLATSLSATTAISNQHILFRDSDTKPANLPSKESTNSYWHREPSKVLMGHRSTEEIPKIADVVVIGSGMAGAFAARELVNGGRDVLMFEAREACWGATGRNGGHCKPAIFSSKPAIGHFELDTYNFLKHLVQQNNIPCDFHVTGTVTSFPTKELTDEAAQKIAALQKSDPELASKVKLVTLPDELQKLRLVNKVGAVTQKNAGKMWPYKLISWVLETLLEEESDSFNLQTNTPVTRLERVGDSWAVTTTRGTVMADNVILATNGYTSHLLPLMKDLIYPVRGQVAAVEVPKDSAPLPSTHVWYVEDSDADVYLIQRNTSNTIILGGLRSTVPGYEARIDDDSAINANISTGLHNACHSALKLRPQSLPDPVTLPSSMDWTGIMGYSGDKHPWVGAVPENIGGGEGLWIVAGFSGHGMPVAARAAMAVAQQLMNQTTGGVKLPDEFVITEERTKKHMTSI